MSLRKKSFTLIEMLIVVVIIGILAAALIPRLQGVQGRARDVQRKTGLSQIGQGMGVWKSDNGDSYSGGISAAAPIAGLVPSYLASIPTDPSNRQFPNDFAATSPALGQYGAMTSTNGAVLVLGAWTEVRGSSNASGAAWAAASFTGMDYAKTQSSQSTASLSDGHAGLRYYYVQ